MGELSVGDGDTQILAVVADGGDVVVGTLEHSARDGQGSLGGLVSLVPDGDGGGSLEDDIPSDGCLVPYLESGCAGRYLSSSERDDSGGIALDCDEGLVDDLPSAHVECGGPRGNGLAVIVSYRDGGRTLRSDDPSPEHGQGTLDLHDVVSVGVLGRIECERSAVDGHEASVSGEDGGLVLDNGFHNSGTDGVLDDELSIDIECRSCDIGQCVSVQVDGHGFVHGDDYILCHVLVEDYDSREACGYGRFEGAVSGSNKSYHGIGICI